MERKSGQPRGRSAAIITVIVLWAVGVTGLMSLLMATHLLPLPGGKNLSAPAGLSPSARSNLTASGFANPPALAFSTNPVWKAVHVLVAGCPCSAYTADCLAQRKPANGFEEFVVVLDGSAPWESPLEHAGFQLKHPEEQPWLAATGVSGGPWLLVISPQGFLVYSGGYAAQRPRPGVTLHDSEILRLAQSGASPLAYPAYGCAATPIAQATFNPVTLCRFIE